jgi:beta-1,4-mannosyl-glycoprotein beta-1,4-N-acetylglucosaminyltransferase
MKVFDCFTFYNELDVLEIRLSLLYPYVDFFVIVEADKSWRLNPKPFCFEENKNRFAGFLDKVIYIKVNDLPDDNDPWKIEEFQRNCILRGLQGCKEDDTVIIADVDEIWDPRLLKECSLYPSRIEMPIYYYCLNYKVNQLWTHPVITKYSVFQNTTPNFLRQKTKDLPIFRFKKSDMAFHLSFFYGKDFSMYKNKFENINHTEYDRLIYKNMDHIKYCIKFGKDLCIREEIKISYVKNKKLLKSPAFLSFKQFYFKKNIFTVFPSMSDLKAIFRIYIFKNYPEIKHDNPLVNSFKYIVKNKLSILK